ncbi:MAG: class A beta-lactamase-related serine hydrolase [Pyrinomonadaceae bacterium MAG19_C2-C3]|nr:class A beta-lactamase-related serine hydrolase [Pyrinomonadaceae bacterium MAG19_C2-C3]
MNRTSSIKFIVGFVTACSVVCSVINTRTAAFAQERQSSSNSRTLTIVKPQSKQGKENQAADLQTIVNRAAETARRKFPSLKADELAISLIDVTNDTHRAVSYRGQAAIYPASVVKMFYMVAAHRQMQDGELKDSPEVRRAMRDMIVDSSNDATHYVLDAVTNTSSGVELSDDEMRAWTNRRNAVNRLFAAQGFTNINVNQKPWCEAPYGRDKIFVNNADASFLSRAVNAAKNNRNMLTTDATARLLSDIATGKAINGERSKQMMDLMRRDFAGATTDKDDQAHGFTGLALTDEKYKNVKLWSKAGWTSTTRHDAAYIETPDGQKFVLVTFTVNHANEREIIPTVAQVVLDAMSDK